MTFIHEQLTGSINLSINKDFQNLYGLTNINSNNFPNCLYNPYNIYSSRSNFPEEYDKYSFIKFIKFLPNNKELLLITNDNKIQLLNFVEPKMKSDPNEEIEDLKNKFQHKTFCNNLNPPQFLFQTKESNYIYDYDMY